MNCRYSRSKQPQTKKLHHYKFISFQAMPGLSERRKMKSSAVFASQEDSFMRMSTNTKGFINTAPPSHDDLRRIIRDLQAAVKEQRERREELEENLKITQQRTLAREKQFYNILEKTHKDVKSFVHPDESGKSSQEIMIIFGEIFQKFEQSNEATNTFIENRYKDNMGMMERRIREIITVVDEEVAKTKRVTDHNFKSVKKQVQEVLLLGIGIEEENRKLKKRLDEEIFKNKLLTEEKNLLIQEIVQKKKLILKYYREGKHSIERTSSAASKIAPVKNALNSTNCQNRQKSTSNVFKFMCEPSIDVSEFNPSRSLNMTKESRAGQKKGGYTTELVSTSFGHGKFQRLLKTPNKSGVVQSRQDYSTADKTIKHLRLSLEREKRKVIELGRIVTQVQNKNNQINEAILQAMQESKRSGNENSIEALVKSQKLFQAIRDLKKRLTMCEKPSIHCGWGEVQINELLTTQ